MPDITRLLRGRRVADVWSRGHELQIRTIDGSEVTVAWVDDNGQPIKGRPVVVEHGYRLSAGKAVQGLLHVPQLIHSQIARTR